MSAVAITRVVRGKRAQIECTDLRSGHSAIISVYTKFAGEAELAVRELMQKYRSINYSRFQDELSTIELGFSY